MCIRDRDYPYDELMQREEYESEKYQLQIELLKLQYWGQDHGQKHIIVFEGRDAAGKGGTIKRFTEHLNPRAARVVALNKPTHTEAGQWYYQRYIQHFPTSGEMVLFDRSWYNRAGVERVMGFCTDEQYALFMKQTPEFERMKMCIRDRPRGCLWAAAWQPFAPDQAEAIHRRQLRMTADLCLLLRSPGQSHASARMARNAERRDGFQRRWTAAGSAAGTAAPRPVRAATPGAPPATRWCQHAAVAPYRGGRPT